jgi:hypothetical protein
MTLVTNSDPKGNTNHMWFIDSGCSNHMTCSKEMFTSMDDTPKSVYVFRSNFLIFPIHIPGEITKTELNWFLLYFQVQKDVFYKRSKNKAKTHLICRKQEKLDRATEKTTPET